MTTEKAYVGSDVKFIIDPASAGFDKTTDEFEVLLKKGTITKLFHKDDMVVDDKDNYYICFNTAEFGKGMIQAVVTIHVPDTDFDDGFRDEVDKFDLLNVLAV